MTEEFEFETLLTQALINHAALEKKFHRRITTRILQNEVKPLKKKFNTVTLTTIGSLIIVACVLIILQIQLVFLTSDFAMPLILLALAVVVGALFALDYFFVKSKGEFSLVNHLGELKHWQQQLKKFQRENTREYNKIKKAFESILNVDSKFILNAFILRYYITSLQEEPPALPAERLYKLLLLISSKKNLNIQKHLTIDDEEAKTLREQLHPYLQHFKQLLSALRAKEPLPCYFKENLSRTIEALESFANPQTRMKKQKT